MLVRGGHGEGGGGAYISSASHASTFEFAAVEFLDCGAEVGCGFELDEAAGGVSFGVLGLNVEGKAYPLPSRSRPVSE